MTGIVPLRTVDKIIADCAAPCVMLELHHARAEQVDMLSVIQEYVEQMHK